MNRRSALPLLSLALAAGLLQAAPKDQARIDSARAYVAGQRAALGLDGQHQFQVLRSHADDLGMTHARFQQTFNGVKVFGGEVIAHMDAEGGQRPLTAAHVRGLNLNTQAALPASEALAAAHRALAPKGLYAHTPTAELVIAPVSSIDVRVNRRTGEITEREVTRYVLAYHVHTELENGTEETKHTDFFVNAHTGGILESWDSLHRGGVKGTGTSQWYGTVTLDTNSTATGFELRDVSGRWASPGAATYDLAGRTSGTGTIYTDVDNTWGDGTWYSGGSTTSANGQTAAVDAHRGLQETYDFYKAIFGRNGIDGNGRAPYSRVHYSSNYDNAFWSDSCFCMTYGDGNSSGSHGEADLDTVAHEVSHGLCFSTANLAYRKESGGLNEANSDIFGTAVEFWVLGGRGATVPNVGSIVVNGNAVSANYKMFENSWAHPYPNEALRWQYKPSRDGSSPDFYSSRIGRLDVHYSSGVANHFFFLLAHGSQVDSLCDNIASPMTNGITSITGIGNDKAIRIWFRALATYMTSSTNYAGARTATLSAAADLYGSGSVEYATVDTAWKAVNVL